jgi:ribosomal 30S subunit maturation factor RimM
LNNSNLVLLAWITGPKGLAGAAKLKFCHSFSELDTNLWAPGKKIIVSWLDFSFSSESELTPEHWQQVTKGSPFTLDWIKSSSPPLAEIKFLEINQRSFWEQKKAKASLWLKKEDFPQSQFDEYYLHQLIGFEVHQDNKLYGVVTAVLMNHQQPIVNIQRQGKLANDEEYLNLLTPVVNKIDWQRKIIFLKMIEYI